MSCPLRSVSEEKTATSAGSQPSTCATICRCTVVVPLPNSAVPTKAANPPSGRSATRDRPGCPPGGMVSSIATAIPVPVAHPSGALSPRPLARAFSTRSRQSSTPMLAVDTSSASPLPFTSSSPSPMRLRRRSSTGSMPSERASSSIADSTANTVWESP